MAEVKFLAKKIEQPRIEPVVTFSEQPVSGSINSLFAKLRQERALFGEPQEEVSPAVENKLQ